MQRACPYCLINPNGVDSRNTVRAGHFWRKSDGKLIQRFSCRGCRKSFSSATQNPCFRQNKRHFNDHIWKSLASGISMRRLALNTHLSRTTINRKLIFLAKQAQLHLTAWQSKQPLSSTVQFDDVETFEHSRCKPLSITLMVEKGSRKILGFEVSEMPSKGKLAQKSRTLYGRRKDQRPKARERLFTRTKPFLTERVLIQSDESPHYPKDVKRHFPLSEHETFKGRRGMSVGYGELKRGGFDPLFSLNHTAACLRDSIKRLARKTWCTTKKKERLIDHLFLYTLYHNTVFLNR